MDEETEKRRESLLMLELRNILENEDEFNG